MKRPKPDDLGTRHPTLWTVEAVRWEYKEDEPESDMAQAKKGRKRPGVSLGQCINAVEVPDHPFAVAVAHHLLDRHAHEAAGRMSLEVSIHPPKADLGTESGAGGEGREDGGPSKTPRRRRRG